MENHTFNTTENITKEDNLEDFEEFDLRDAINVGAYSLMSASKVLFWRIYFLVNVQWQWINIGFLMAVSSLKYEIVKNILELDW